MNHAARRPSRAVALHGTDEPVPALRILSAGELTAELHAGNLRHIRLRAIELMRAVSFIVRDRDWGIYSTALSDLRIAKAATASASPVRLRQATTAGPVFGCPDTSMQG